MFVLPEIICQFIGQEVILFVICATNIESKKFCKLIVVDFIFCQVGF